VTFAATVIPQFGGAVSGTVQFIKVKDSDDENRDDAPRQIVLGVAAVDSQGNAIFTTSTLKTGQHSIIAVYSGDNNLTGSTSPIVRPLVKGGGSN
jgi:hypothetical protein